MALSIVRNSGSFTIGAVALQSSNVTSYTEDVTTNAEQQSTIASVSPPLTIQNVRVDTITVEGMLDGTEPIDIDDLVSVECIYTAPLEFTSTYTATATDSNFTVDPQTKGRMNFSLTLIAESKPAYVQLS